MPRIAEFEHSVPAPIDVNHVDPVVFMDHEGVYRYLPPGQQYNPLDPTRGCPPMAERGFFVGDGSGRTNFGWGISERSQLAERLGVLGNFVCWSSDLGYLLDYSRRYLEEHSVNPFKDLPTSWPALTFDGPRVPRLISAEQELATGRTNVEWALRHQGIFVSGRDYSRNIPIDHDGLKIGYGMSDSSCDGELVFSKLDLSNSAHADRYGQAATIVQALADDGQTTISFNCGHHVHVSGGDIEGRLLTPNSLRRLYAIIGHVEPVLYRLGEGGLGRHRGERYAQKVPKLEGTRTTAIAINGAFLRDRYFSINLYPYLEAIQNCRCGALTFGKWRDCTCHTIENGGTVEFRIWNGVTRPDTVHAFLILSAAIIELAVKGRGLFDLTETEWSPGTMVGGGTSKTERDAYRWLVDTLPLSDTERTQVERLATRTSMLEAVTTHLPPLPDNWESYVATLKPQRNNFVG